VLFRTISSGRIPESRVLLKFPYSVAVPDLKIMNGIGEQWLRQWSPKHKPGMCRREKASSMSYTKLSLLSTGIYRSVAYTSGWTLLANCTVLAFRGLREIRDVAVERAALLLRVREVPRSDIGCPDWGFSYFSLAPPRRYWKRKAVPLHAMEAHGGRGGIAPTHT
jgi:hypothetical protein